MTFRSKGFLLFLVQIGLLAAGGVHDANARSDVAVTDVTQVLHPSRASTDSSAQLEQADGVASTAHFSEQRNTTMPPPNQGQNKLESVGSPDMPDVQADRPERSVDVAVEDQLAESALDPQPVASCGAASIQDDTLRRSEYLRLVREFCSKEQPSSDDKPFYQENEYFVSKKARAIFAFNTKAMSTTLRFLVLSLEGHQNTTRNTKEEIQLLSWFSPEEAQEMLRTFARVLFVRHPFSRIYSAWGDKFVKAGRTCAEQNKCEGTWLRLGKKILETQGLDVPKNKSQLFAEITWDRFLTNVLTSAARNRHWSVQADQNRICAYQPTFIGAVEHSRSDFPAMMEAIGSDPSILDRLMSKNVNPYKKPVDDYAKLFPEPELQQATDMFKHDFEAFGYSPALHCVKQ